MAGKMGLLPKFSLIQIGFGPLSPCTDVKASSGANAMRRSSGRTRRISRPVIDRCVDVRNAHMVRL